MPIAVIVRLAWRNLLRNARRSLFGLATIAFGVIGLALAAGFIEDVFEQLGEATISGQLGHVQIAREGFFSGGAGTPEEYLIAQPEALRKRLAADPRVIGVMGRLTFSGLLSTGRADLAIEGQGVEPLPEARLGSRLDLLVGRNLEEADTMVAVIGEGVARQLGAKVGDTLMLTAPTLDGAMNLIDVEVVGVFRSFSKDFDDRAIRVPLPLAFDLLQAEAVNSMVVHLGETRDTDAVMASLEPTLAGSGLEARAWYRLSDFYASTRDMYAKQFGFLRLIALVLVVMSVVNSLNMTVFERTAEFGTMRVLGNRGADVIGLIVTEALLLGVLGALAGAGLAVLLASVISAVGIPMPPPPNMEAGYTARIMLTPAAVLQACAIGAVSAVLASLFPAFRVVRTPIVDALRRAV